MTRLVDLNDIRAIYRTLLGREIGPNEVDFYINKCTINELIDVVSNSREARIYSQNVLSSRYFSYNSSIDAINIVTSHEDSNRKSIPNRLVNYLGVIIDPAYLPHVLEGMKGTVEDVPIPANWHADLAEFAAALRAVDLANDSFRMVELGCGWGCWLLNTGVAARRRGLKIELLGVDGDIGHVKFAIQGCEENSFLPHEVKILRRIVGPKSGEALFPRQEVAGVDWGLEPIFNPTDDQISKAGSGSPYDIVPILTFADICEDGKPIDLVHMDIQGGEGEFIAQCIDQMNKFVAYAVIGTHSRIIEGRIFEIMLKHGWRLEIERPAIIELNAEQPIIRIDGVQGWRNPRVR